MIEARWSLGGFNIFYSGKYNDIFGVENDFEALMGLENFLGFGSDWFLVQKKTKKLAFMLLEIPAAINKIVKINTSIFLNEFREMQLEEFIYLEKYATHGEHSAFFSETYNILYSINSDNIVYKVPVSKDFFMLLNASKERCGFVLINATDNILTEDGKKDNPIFSRLLGEMLYFCNDNKYKLMEDGTSSERELHLNLLLALEDECKKMQEKDGRIFHILHFIKNSKYAFYDIE